MASTQTGPDPFGNDLFPALQTLSKFIEPYGKGKFVSPPAYSTIDKKSQLAPSSYWRSYPDFFRAGALLLQPNQRLFSFFLLVSRTSGGSLKIQIPIQLISLLPTPSKHCPNISVPILKARRLLLNPHGLLYAELCIVGFFVALACYLPLQHGAPIPFQPWVYCLLLAVVAVIGFFSPTAKFCGPLRFGYLEYAQYFVQIYKILLSWWLYAAFFLLSFPPFFGFGIICMSVAAWFYIYREYCKQVQEINDRAAKAVSRATLAVAYAREYVTVASKYQKQMLDVVAVTRRDVLLTKTVKITDFFDCAAHAWAALGRVTAPANDVTTAARKVVEAAMDAEDSEKPDEEAGRTEELVKYLLEKAEAAVMDAEGVEKQLKVAQEAVESSENAQREITWARSKAMSNARDATIAANELAGKIAGSSVTLFSAAEGADDVKRLAEQATAAAIWGEMESARAHAAAAATAAIEVVKAMETLRLAMDEAYRILFGLLQKI